MPIESSVVLVALKVGGALVTAGRTISALVSGEKNRQFQEQQRIASENFQRERDAINYLRERERDAINHLREAELRMKEIDEQHKNALERDTINYHREAELRMKVIEEQHKNALEMVVIYGK